MRKLVILILIIIGLGLLWERGIIKVPPENQLACPDEKIINRMPGPGGGSSSYYIKNGKRVELNAYPDSWVENNCNVAVQEVY